MTLTDANILYALIDPRQKDHARCKSALSRLSMPMVTTCICLTEAMYFAYKTGGWQRQNQLWKLVQDGLLEVAHLSDLEMQKIAALMQKYQDTPMDLADASLVAFAESHGHSTIFTLDSDFYIYKLADDETFIVVP